MTLVLRRQLFRSLPRRIVTTGTERDEGGGGRHPFTNDFYHKRLDNRDIRWLPSTATKTSPPNTSQQPILKNDDTTSITPRTTPMQALIDPSTKGFGQVIFLNSKTSGRIIAASVAIGDPFLAVMATLGTLTATVTAKYVPLQPSCQATLLNNGLYSYNGCLIGCASSVFLSSTFTTTSSVVLASTALTLTGAASATIATAIFNKICPPMPQWTYGFNVVMLTALLRIQPLAPKLATTPSTVSDVVDSTTASTVSIFDIVSSPLTGLSQIFVVESVWTGVGILAAIASYSPGLAYHAIMGSTVGCMVGTLVYNVPINDITAGLWGYNSALTSLGVGVFFVPSNRTSALSFTGAMATAAVLGAMQPLFTSTPCLTIPFCLTMSACWLLGTPTLQQTTAVIPGLILAPNPHSPEKNVL